MTDKISIIIDIIAILCGLASLYLILLNIWIIAALMLFVMTILYSISMKRTIKNSE